MNGVKTENNKDISKLDLSTIEQIILPNGNGYIKYFDNLQNRPVMLKTANSTIPVKEQIEKLQSHSHNLNSQNTMYNTKKLAEIERKYTREEIILVPVDQLDKYQYLINDVDPQSMKLVSIFVKNKDRFNPPIKYINFDDCIALDEMNRAIVCQYNETTGQYDVRYADVIKHEKEEKVVYNDIEATVSNSDYSAIVDTIEITNRPVEVSGYMIDLQTLQQFYDYPELFERKEMKQNERYIWTKILEVYKIKKNLKDDINDKHKVFVKKKDNKKAGFANHLLTASLAGFTVGIVFAILIAIIQHLFF